MNFSFKKEDKDNNCIYKINLKYKIKKKEKSDNLIIYNDNRRKRI